MAISKSQLKKALGSRLEAYYSVEAENVRATLTGYGVRRDIIEAILTDYHNLLLYKDEPFTGTIEQVRAFADNDNMPNIIKWAKEGIKHYAVVIDDYLHLGGMFTALDVINTATEKQNQGDNSAFTAEALRNAADIAVSGFKGLYLPTAVTFAERYVVLTPIDGADLKGADKYADMKRRQTGKILRLFLFCTACLLEAKATDAEIKAYVGTKYFEEDYIQRVIDSVRSKYTDFVNKKDKKAKFYLNILQAGSQPLIMATEERARAAEAGEDIITQPMPTGVYTIKQVIAKKQEEENERVDSINAQIAADITAQATAEGKTKEEIEALVAQASVQPLRISEERVYQVYTALQVLANEHGTPIVGREGVEQFGYDMSLRALARIACGVDDPDGTLLRQIGAALNILENYRVAVEEVRYSYVDTNDKEKYPSGKKPVERRYRHYIKLLNIPNITQRINPDGTLADAGNTTLQIRVHALLRTGKRQEQPIQNGKQMQYITAPATFVPYEMYEKSRDYFRSHDGNGARFYSMLLAKDNKREEDMLCEIFDFEGKVKIETDKAEKRVRKKHDARMKGDIEEVAAYLQELAQAKTSIEQMIAEAKAEAEKKARRAITNKRGRYMETLQKWFEQAAELGIIEPNPQRVQAKTRKGYVWKWRHYKEPTEEQLLNS